MSGSGETVSRQTFERLAGFLSERSVQDLVLAVRGHAHVLRARGCDLPGELALAAADGFVLTATALQLEIVLRPGQSSMSWTCPDPRVTLDLARALCD
ncbi:MAG TPA: hypothetical protein VF777_15605 [Phycisphaerales bacterium]